MKVKKVMTAACAALMLITGSLTACSKDSSSSKKAEEASSDAISDSGMTAQEVVKLMGNGINLGNTFEAYNHGNYVAGGDPTSSENTWGQPTTTKEMIAGMKACGFDSIRIPVAWTNAMNFETGDYTIDEAYLNRVEEVVNYALDNDMYVVINDHWDGGWWGMFGSASEETRTKAMDMYVSMWTQLCDRFGKYDDKLIFESANEELGDRLNDKDIAEDSGSLSKDECYTVAHDINQKFVDTVRASGGNNANRFLLIAGYNTDITCTCDDRFVMPTDTAKDKLILSVHYYTPWDYCGEKAVDHWGSVQDVKEQNELLKSLSKFCDQGYGVIIGEYAVLTNSNYPKNDTDLFYTNFLNNCDLYNYCPMLWDCNNLYDKYTCTIVDDPMYELFTGRSLKAQSSLTDDEIKANAKAAIDQFAKEAEERQFEDMAIPASDTDAIAWIMYNSSDFAVSYSVGDVYDPTNMSSGVKATNVIVTGDGSYEVSLDFTNASQAKGIGFSALGISNGEDLFPGATIKIDEIAINGEPVELVAKEYTSSDDGHCTRVNIFNGYISEPPKDSRSYDGDLTNALPQIVDVSNNTIIRTLTVKFTFKTAA
ncbi:MAG: glycoside hydrolase family 5 protein [Ruminococcus sp.]|nr:glycoside hydrolase family 5 protein [Ruminococcus sp.]